MSFQKKSKPNLTTKRPNNEWFKNAARSMGMASLELVDQLFPATGEFIVDNGSYIKDLRHQVKDAQRQSKPITDMLNISTTVNTGKKVISNAKEDLKTGKLWNDERDNFGMDDSDEFGDYDFLDIDGDDQVEEDGDPDDPEKDSEKVIDKDTQININSDNRPVIKALQDNANVTLTAAEGIVSNQLQVAESTTALTHKSSSVAIKGLESINNNLSLLVNFQNDSMSKYIATSIKYYDESITHLNTAAQALLRANPIEGEVKEKKKTKFDIFGAYGGLNVQEYIGQIGYNLQNSNNDLLNMINMVFTNETFLESLVSSPFKQLTKSLVTNLIPQTMRDMSERLDQTFAEFSPAMLMRLNRWKSDDANPIQQLIADIFGVKTSTKTSIDTKLYKKGEVPWDGKSKRSLEEVIPRYLSSIESLLSGNQERFFDFQEGVWSSASDMKSRLDKQVTNVSLSGFSDLIGEMRDTLNGFKFQDPKERERVDDHINNLFKNVARQDAQVNFTDLEDITRVYDFGLDNSMAEFIQGLITTSSNNAQMAAAGSGQLRSRANMKKFYEEAELDPSIYNLGLLSSKADLNRGFKEKDGELTAKKGYGLSNIDKFGKTNLDYLRSILDTLEQGITVCNDCGPNKSKSKGRNATVDNPFKDRRDKRLEEEEKYVEKQTPKIKAEKELDSEKLAKQGVIKADNVVDLMSNYGDFKNAKNDLASLRAYSEGGEKEETKLRKAVDFVGANLSDKAQENYYKIVEKVDDIANKPAEILKGVFDKIDNTMYNLVFGVKNNGNESFLTSVMNKMQTMFQDISDFAKDRVFGPITEFILGDNGIWNKAKDNPFVTKVTEGTSKFFMGGMNAKGEYEDGVFSGIRDSLGDMSKSTVHMLNGGGYEDSKGIFHPEDKDNSVGGLIKSGAKTVLAETSKYIKGDPNSEDADSRKGIYGDLYNDVKASGSRWTEAIFGPADKSELHKEHSKSLEEAGQKVGKALPKAAVGALGGGAIGAGILSAMGPVGALGAFVLPGGPVGLAMLGAGLGIASESTRFNEWAFGVENDNGKRTGGALLSANTQEFIKKNKSTMMGGAAVGAATNLLGFGVLPAIMGPAGPLGAAVIGSATAMALRSDKVQDMLFGPKDLDGERMGGVVQKLFSGVNNKIAGENKDGKGKLIDIGIGAAGGAGLGTLIATTGLMGAMLSPAAPIGLAVAGAAAGMALTNDRWKTYMFGDWNEDTGEKEGGLAQKFTNWTQINIMDPLKFKAEDTLSDMSFWFKDTIVDSLQYGLSPIKDAAVLAGKDLVGGFKAVGRTANKLIGEPIKDHVAIPLGKAMRMTLLEPTKFILDKTFDLSKGIFKTMVGLPFNAISGLGQLADGALMLRGATFGAAQDVGNIITGKEAKAENEEDQVSRMRSMANIINPAEYIRNATSEGGADEWFERRGQQRIDRAENKAIRRAEHDELKEKRKDWKARRKAAENTHYSNYSGDHERLDHLYKRVKTDDAFSHFIRSQEDKGASYNAQLKDELGVTANQLLELRDDRNISRITKGQRAILSSHLEKARESNLKGEDLLNSLGVEKVITAPAEVSAEATVKISEVTKDISETLKTDSFTLNDSDQRDALQNVIERALESFKGKSPSTDENAPTISIPEISENFKDGTPSISDVAPILSTHETIESIKDVSPTTVENAPTISIPSTIENFKDLSSSTVEHNPIVSTPETVEKGNVDREKLSTAEYFKTNLGTNGISSLNRKVYRYKDELEMDEEAILLEQEKLREGYKAKMGHPVDSNIPKIKDAISEPKVKLDNLSKVQEGITGSLNRFKDDSQDILKMALRKGDKYAEKWNAFSELMTPLLTKPTTIDPDPKIAMEENSEVLVDKLTAINRGIKVTTVDDQGQYIKPKEESLMDFVFKNVSRAKDGVMLANSSFSLMDKVSNIDGLDPRIKGFLEKMPAILNNIERFTSIMSDRQEETGEAPDGGPTINSDTIDPGNNGRPTVNRVTVPPTVSTSTIETSEYLFDKLTSSDNPIAVKIVESEVSLGGSSATQEQGEGEEGGSRRGSSGVRDGEDYNRRSTSTMGLGSLIGGIGKMIGGGMSGIGKMVGGLSGKIGSIGGFGKSTGGGSSILGFLNGVSNFAKRTGSALDSSYRANKASRILGGGGASTTAQATQDFQLANDGTSEISQRSLHSKRRNVNEFLGRKSQEQSALMDSKFKHANIDLLGQVSSNTRMIAEILSNQYDLDHGFYAWLRNWLENFSPCCGGGGGGTGSPSVPPIAVPIPVPVTEAVPEDSVPDTFIADPIPNNIFDKIDEDTNVRDTMDWLLGALAAGVAGKGLASLFGRKKKPTNPPTSPTIKPTPKPTTPSAKPADKTAPKPTTPAVNTNTKPGTTTTRPMNTNIPTIDGPRGRRKDINTGEYVDVDPQRTTIDEKSKPKVGKPTIKPSPEPILLRNEEPQKEPARRHAQTTRRATFGHYNEPPVLDVPYTDIPDRPAEPKVKRESTNLEKMFDASDEDIRKSKEAQIRAKYERERQKIFEDVRNNKSTSKYDEFQERLSKADKEFKKSYETLDEDIRKEKETYEKEKTKLDPKTGQYKKTAFEKLFSREPLSEVDAPDTKPKAQVKDSTRKPTKTETQYFDNEETGQTKNSAKSLSGKEKLKTVGKILTGGKNLGIMPMTASRAITEVIAERKPKVDAELPKVKTVAKETAEKASGKEIAKVVAKSGGKSLLKTGLGVATGGLASLAFGAFDAAAGYQNAGEYLGKEESEVTKADKIGVGAGRAVMGAVPFADMVDQAFLDGKLSEKVISLSTSITNGIGNVDTNIKDTFTTVGATVSENAALLKEDATEKWESIKADAGTKWDNLSTTISENTESLKASTTEKWEGLKTDVGTKWAEISTDVTGKAENMKASATEKWETLKTNVGTKWTEISTDVTTKATEMKANATENWETLKTNVSDKWTEISTNVTTKASEMKATATENWETLKTNVGTKWTEISTDVTTKAAQMKASATEKWEGLKTNVGTKWTEISSTVGTKAAQMKASATEKWEGLKTNVGTKWTEISSTVGTKTAEMKKNATEKWQTLTSETSAKWDNIKTTVGTKVNEIKTTANTKLGEGVATASKNLSDFGEKVGTAATNISSNIRTKLNVSDSAISLAIGDFAGQISSIASGIAGKIKSFVSKAGDAITGGGYGKGKGETKGAVIKNVGGPATPVENLINKDSKVFLDKVGKLPNNTADIKIKKMKTFAKGEEKGAIVKNVGGPATSIENLINKDSNVLLDKVDKTHDNKVKKPTTKRGEKGAIVKNVGGPATPVENLINNDSKSFLDKVGKLPNNTADIKIKKMKTFAKGEDLFTGGPESPTVKGIMPKDEEILEAFGKGNDVYYSQKDPRWANKALGGGAKMSTSGCGPTAASMVVSSLTGKQVSPVEAAEFASNRGYVDPDKGVSSDMFADFGQKNGVNVSQVEAKPKDVLNSLMSGEKLILRGQGGDNYTDGGHYIVADGLTKDGKVNIKDPLGKAKSGQKDLKSLLRSTTHAFSATTGNGEKESILAKVSYGKGSAFTHPVPTARKTSNFGYRNIGAGKEFHYGLDFAQTGDVPIQAAASGTVTKAGITNGYGYYVIIQHSIGGKRMDSTYAHLRSNLQVKAGDPVEQGQVVGYMGNTGRSTGQHLHFEIHDGPWVYTSSKTMPNAVDPAPYVLGTGNATPNPFFGENGSQSATSSSSSTESGKTKAQTLMDKFNGIFDKGIFNNDFNNQFTHTFDTIANNILFGTDDEVGLYNAKSSSSNVDTSIPNLSGSENAEKVWNYFRGKGVNNFGIAGIMGNLQQESGMDPTKRQSGGTAKGIAQWEGGRWTNLVNKAKAAGVSEWDLPIQLQHIWSELNGEDPTTTSILNKRFGGINSLKNSPDYKEATKVFQESFERAGEPMYEKRYKYAQDYYQVYNAEVDKKASTSTTANGVGGPVMKGRDIEYDASMIDEMDKTLALGSTSGYGDRVVSSTDSRFDSTAVEETLDKQFSQENNITIENKLPETFGSGGGDLTRDDINKILGFLSEISSNTNHSGEVRHVEAPKHEHTSTSRNEQKAGKSIPSGKGEGNASFPNARGNNNQNVSQATYNRVLQISRGRR